MAAMELSVLVLLFSVAGIDGIYSSVEGEHFPTEKPKRCLRHRSYGMIAADCYGRNLQYVPDDLNNDIQALDLSFNRIRELDRESLSKYSSLELLFLDDNMISFIANDTFEPLQNLEVVLLKLNALTHVPTSLFRLPYLRKLDLSDNRLMMSGMGTFAEAPITNHIKWLSLANCHMHQLPPLHKFVHLEYLNISFNPLNHLDARELAPLCSLRTLDLGASFTTLSHCDCLVLAEWASEGKMMVFPPEALDCAGSQSIDSKCRASNQTRQAHKLRKQCTKIVAQHEKQEYMNKIWLYAGSTSLAVLVIIIIIIIWVVCRCRKRRRRILSKNASGKSGSDSSDTTLLPPGGMQNGTGDFISPAAQTGANRRL